MQVPCLCGTRKSRRRVKSALRKQRYTVTPFDCNLLAHLIVPWPMQKFMCYCTVFALFYFEFEGNFQVQALGAYIWRGYLMEGFLRHEFGGAYFRNSVVVLQPYLFLLLYSSW